MNEEIKSQIKNEIDSNDVCLFMKGTPDAPQCGFSMAVSNILKLLNVKFFHQESLLVLHLLLLHRCKLLF